jgi:heme-degrading monooxygenase HmoA
MIPNERPSHREGSGAVHARMTYTKLDPSSVDEARDFYNSEEVSGAMRQQQGYRFNYLLESVDTPGEAISMTAWDSREDAEAYERSGVYQKLIGKFRQYFVEPPELKTYEVPDMDSLRSA